METFRSRHADASRVGNPARISPGAAEIAWTDTGLVTDRKLLEAGRQLLKVRALEGAVDSTEIHACTGDESDVDALRPERHVHVRLLSRPQ
jgi:hypothetical protein